MNFMERDDRASFTCDNCGKSYSVSELVLEKKNVRSYKCKECDHRVFVAHA